MIPLLLQPVKALQPRLALFFTTKTPWLNRRKSLTLKHLPELQGRLGRRNLKYTKFILFVFRVFALSCVIPAEMLRA
jgi:hypothetical protein